jgi:hypothetical protein
MPVLTRQVCLGVMLWNNLLPDAARMQPLQGTHTARGSVKRHLHMIAMRITLQSSRAADNTVLNSQVNIQVLCTLFAILSGCNPLRPVFVVVPHTLQTSCQNLFGMFWQ